MNPRLLLGLAAGFTAGAVLATSPAFATPDAAGPLPAAATPAGVETAEPMPRSGGPAPVTPVAGGTTTPTPTVSVSTTILHSDETWDALAQCESSGRWGINSGNGFSGGLQFSFVSWLHWRADDDPWEAWLASRERQIAAAERYVAYERSRGRGGFGPWATCARRLGLPR